MTSDGRRGSGDAARTRGGADRGAACAGERLFHAPGAYLQDQAIGDPKSSSTLPAPDADAKDGDVSSNCLAMAAGRPAGGSRLGWVGQQVTAASERHLRYAARPAMCSCVNTCMMKSTRTSCRATGVIQAWRTVPGPEREFGPTVHLVLWSGPVLPRSTMGGSSRSALLPLRICLCILPPGAFRALWAGPPREEVLRRTQWGVVNATPEPATDGRRPECHCHLSPPSTSCTGRRGTAQSRRL